MKFKKILIVGVYEDSLDEKCWFEIKSLGEKVVSIKKDSQDFEKELKESDCLLTGFGIEVNKKHIDAASALKYIGVLATAYGKVDIEYAAKKNIPVCNLAGYSTESVAEFTIGAILESLEGCAKVSLDRLVATIPKTE